MKTYSQIAKIKDGSKAEEKILQTTNNLTEGDIDLCSKEELAEALLYWTIQHDRLVQKASMADDDERLKALNKLISKIQKLNP